MKAYIIHHDQCLDRKDSVQELQRKTGAEIIEAVWEENRVKGCKLSHMKVAWQAKQDDPEKSYLVFEDDCELLQDIDVVLSSLSDADVVYLGFTDIGWDHQGGYKLLYGTHAVKMSPKARDIVLQYADWSSEPYDHILNRLAQSFNLTVAHHDWHKRESFARQRKGYISTITGNPRK